VQLFLRGGGTMSNKEKLGVGDVLVIDTDQPHEMLNSDFEHLTLVLPRDLNPKLSAQLEHLHATRIPGDNPLVRLFGDHLCSLWRNLKNMNMHQARAAVQGTTGLMQSWLANSLDEDPATAEALAQSIRRYLERNLAQPLQVEQLVTTFRVSRSQLYRMFQAYGGVANYLWERRLRRSLWMLLQPRFARTSIAIIAFECGFSSEAHFSRKFKAAFGMTPKKAREEGITAIPRQWDKSAMPEHYSIEFRYLIETFTFTPAEALHKAL
jgi:AraC-like DNA-binding protein